MPLDVERIVLKPYEYPWAFDAWKAQHSVHWLPDEVPLADDVKDWHKSLTESERHLVTQIFRFFTQSDVEVNNCYHKVYMNVFKVPEVTMMLTAFSDMECFDDKTELLTSTGWKNVADITSSDKVAQYNIETKEVSFMNPKKVVSYPYKGIMHSYKNMTTDIMVTPNHDMIARHPSTGKVDKVKSYKRILGRNYLYPASGKSNYQHAPLTTMERILIATQADGCLRGECPSAGEWRTVDFTFHKQRKIDRLSELLVEAGIEFSLFKKEENRTRMSFNMPEGVDISSIKEFGFFNIEKTSAQKAKEIIDEIVFWDGTINVGSGQRSYYTSKKNAGDFVQAITCLTGENISNMGINRDIGEELTLPNGNNYVMDKPHYVVTLTDGRAEKTYPHREEVEYDGNVYCVSVDTENLVSRRNGKVAFTGNTIHVVAYSHLLDTLGMPEVEYSAFLQYEAMKDKFDYMRDYLTGEKDAFAIAETLAAFGAFTEGLQLFASFAILLNFQRFNKLKGMGQIVTYSARDETIHCLSLIRLFHQWVNEHPEIDKEKLAAKLAKVCQEIVSHEDKFIDLAFEAGTVEGLSPAEVKAYIRYMADIRLVQLGLDPIYNIGPNPLPWMDAILNGVEFAAFFEQKATEYSKGATEGNWEDVWPEDE